jgi:hypothetical protein
MALKNRDLVFAKNCSNAHGTFAKGDVARGAFSDQLVADYLAVGILVDRTPAPDVPFTDEGDMPAEQPADQAPEADTTPEPVIKSRKR